LKEAILEGQVKNDYEDAKRFLIDLYEKIKTNPDLIMENKK
jgi:hypothetical protein